MGHGIRGLAEVKEDCIDAWGFGLIQDGCPIVILVKLVSLVNLVIVVILMNLAKLLIL